MDGEIDGGVMPPLALITGRLAKSSSSRSGKSEERSASGPQSEFLVTE